MVATEGEEAATFYTSDFKNSSIRDVSRHGEAGPCGWLKDKYGVSWQVIPTALNELLSDPDPEKSQRAMKAMLAMSKIDIEASKRAAEQEAGPGRGMAFARPVHAGSYTRREGLPPGHYMLDVNGAATGLMLPLTPPDRACSRHPETRGSLCPPRRRWREHRNRG
jgi:hypothetical protein